MTIPTTTTTSTDAQPITCISKDEFIQQGYDIIYAYAERYHLKAVRPYDGPSQLAAFIWKRYADQSGTIPLLDKHTAVRLSNGHLRVMERRSDPEGLITTYPVPDSLVDAPTPCPPIEPPETDEIHTLPKQFRRAAEEEDQPSRQLDTAPFPSAPTDLYSPRGGLIFPDVELSEPASPQPATPKPEFEYPPRGQLIYGPDGGGVGYERASPRWINRMMEHAGRRRQQIKQLFDETKAELASTVLELWKAKNDLNSSVAESELTIENMKSQFGTRRASQTVNAKEEIEKRFNALPAESTRQSPSSRYYYEDGNVPSDSRAYTWSSRDSPTTSHRAIVCGDATNIIATDPPPKRNIDDAEISEAREMAFVLPSKVGESAQVVPSPPPRSRRQKSTSPPTTTKRAREEDLDSETEVEASILYDDTLETESPKKRRLDEAGTSVRSPSPRRSSLKNSQDMDVDKNTRPVHRVRFAENPVPSASHYGQSTSSESSSPRSKTLRKATAPASRRPLVRSTSKLLPAEDGGLYYVKYYPPKSKSNGRLSSCSGGSGSRRVDLHLR